MKQKNSQIILDCSDRYCPNVWVAMLSGLGHWRHWLFKLCLS